MAKAMTYPSAPQARNIAMRKLDRFRKVLEARQRKGDASGLTLTSKKQASRIAAAKFERRLDTIRKYAR